MSETVQAVERAIDILFIVGATSSGAGITDIAAEVGLSKGAVHRILVALANKGMVLQDALTQRYTLGPRVLELDSYLRDQTDLVSLAQPYLDSLRDQFRETASLALRTDVTYLYVSTRPAPREYRITPLVGKPLPLHWTGFGKAILAHMRPEEVSAYLSQGELARATDKTIVDPEALLVELRAIQARGYATSSGERVEGAFAIAAAIVDEHYSPVGAIGLSGPASRLSAADQVEMGARVAAAARSLSLALRAGMHNLSPAVNGLAALAH